MLIKPILYNIKNSSEWPLHEMHKNYFRKKSHKFSANH